MKKQGIEHYLLGQMSTTFCLSAFQILIPDTFLIFSSLSIPHAYLESAMAQDMEAATAHARVGLAPKPYRTRAIQLAPAPDINHSPVQLSARETPR